MNYHIDLLQDAQWLAADICLVFAQVWQLEQYGTPHFGHCLVLLTTPHFGLNLHIRYEMWRINYLIYFINLYEDLVLFIKYSLKVIIYNLKSLFSHSNSPISSTSLSLTPYISLFLTSVRYAYLIIYCC